MGDNGKCDSAQFSTFKDCLARRVLAEPGVLAEHTDTEAGQPEDDSDALDDFTSYLAEEIWPVLPPELRDATHESKDRLPDIDDLSLESLISPSFSDTLVSCGLIDDADSAVAFLRRALKDYVEEASAPPPVWSKTRTTECEICEREVPLTYHHLIPREVHDKVRKKKWHPENMLNSVAWLCRSVSTRTVHLYQLWSFLSMTCVSFWRIIVVAHKRREDPQMWDVVVAER